MARVTGIGGVFFKAQDLEQTRAWYRDMLGIESEWGATLPFAADSAEAYSVLSPFKGDTDYFAPSPHAVMLNLRVDDLDGILAHLAARGVAPLGRQDEEYGRFAWVLDPNGIKIELWQQLGPAPS
jgi:catechol 2,3-dioxygenase-like lactoylglutathione lyase family enzyme